MTPNMRILCAAGALVVSACMTAGDSSSSWSRSYLAERNRVIEGVVDVLEDQEYLVDVDDVGGRIDAEPSRSGSRGRAILVVRIAEKKGRTRVVVQTRTGMDSSGRPGGPVEAQVLEFLHELDLRLRR